jgi:hypothetical protein
MKTVFTSLILAGIICLLLTFTGVLHFDFPPGSWQEDEPTQDVNSQDLGESSPADSESSIHARALQFLGESEYKDGARVEERFAEFLQQELGLDQTEADKLLRMSFWKNFVTLQHEWQSDEMERMEISFIQEEELKQAGFKAKGLILMAGQLQEAKDRFLDLKQQLSTAALGGESP